MKKILFLALAATLTLGSCVTNKKYNKLQMEYQSTRDGLFLTCLTVSRAMIFAPMAACIAISNC